MRVFETRTALDAALDLPPLDSNAFRFAKQFMPAGFRCADCGEVKPFHANGRGTGYASCDDKPDGLVCYACRGIRDRKQMDETGRATLYLTMERGIASNYGPWFSGHISNWPGTLKINVNVKRGAHNMARYRYDVWFNFNGAKWHGVQYGENTQIIHCKRAKG